MRCEKAPERTEVAWLCEEADAFPAATEAYDDLLGITPVLGAVE